MNNKRVWRPKMKNPVDPVADYKNYQSYQKIINSNNGEINEELLNEHINEMMSDEMYKWEEIPVDFKKLNPGDRIRYTTRTPEGKHLFRTGGWITHIDENGVYLAYMAHTKTTWTLQAEDCQRLFVVRKVTKFKVELVRTVYFKRPESSLGLGYDSYLPKDGETHLVGTFRSKYDLERFESRSKFIQALETEDWDFKE